MIFWRSGQLACKELAALGLEGAVPVEFMDEWQFALIDHNLGSAHSSGVLKLISSNHLCRHFAIIIVMVDRAILLQ